MPSKDVSLTAYGKASTYSVSLTKETGISFVTGGGSY
jgi:hypothetical protein